ncbi:hypothetical protein BOX15_Mlig026908g3, partial [Macrostomum lignano]
SRSAAMSGMRLDCKIYVGELPRDASESELERAFKSFGRVRQVWIARNPPGFAFIEMDDPRDAEDAVRDLDGSTICGVRARVEMSSGRSRPKGFDRGGRDRGGPRRGFDPNDRCYDCGEKGHYAYNCPRKRGGGGGGRGGRSRSRSRSRSNDRDRRGRRSPSYSDRSRSRSPPPRRRRSRSGSSNSR